MFLRRLVLFVTLLALASCFLAACSDDDADNPPAVMKGTVTDTGGTPIANAALLVSFRPSFEDVLFPLAADKDLPPTTLTSLRVLDPCDNVVRTLCDGDCGGQSTIIWDGRDDQGLRVVEGLYYYEAASPDSMIRRAFVMIHMYTEWDTEECEHHALTDADGKYTFDDKCLGFGTEVTTTDEEGNVIDTRPILRLVNLHLVTDDGRMARRDSVYWPEHSSLTVDFTLAR